MSSAEVFSPAPLQFSNAAAAKVKALIEEEDNAELKLRVFVTGGGCSGFQPSFLGLNTSHVWQQSVRV